MKNKSRVRGKTRSTAPIVVPPVRTAAKPAHRIDPARLNARPDPIDFRDLMFEPTLVEVPQRITLEDYRATFGRRAQPPVLDQLSEGACTGFGLAAVANALLHRRRVFPDRTPVSARMFYEMARRYDEWPGEGYSGSSARGAMKGWHKHGVCAEREWPYVPDDAGTLTHQRAKDAAARPLGAYFRVNHLNLVAMHAALAEVGILYATGSVHSGWSEIDPKTGVIPGPEGKDVLGGPAFAIVGYDERGFWLQNSWGPSWGKGGFALITY
ncbi:MAG TPA: C1 family peptidase, partial [Opitutus sp.]|nr:C1 family peptidase [Opitutus sp.]